MKSSHICFPKTTGLVLLFFCWLYSSSAHSQASSVTAAAKGSSKGKQDQVAKIAEDAGKAVSTTSTLKTEKLKSKSPKVNGEISHSKPDQIKKKSGKTGEEKVLASKKEASKKKKKRKLGQITRTQWFFPQSFPQSFPLHKSKNSMVIFSGKTAPDSEVSIPTRATLIKAPMGSSKAYADDEDEAAAKLIDISAQRSTADDFGYFRLEVILPYGRVQLPITIKKPDGKSRKYMLSFENKKDGTISTKSNKFVVNPLAAKKFRLSMGLGTNFLKYSQESSEIDLSLNHQSLSGPSFYLDAQWKPVPDWSYMFSWKNSPGKLPSSGDFVINKTEYVWEILALDVKYEPQFFYTSTFKKYDTSIGVIAGFQKHSVPFLSRIGPSSKNLEMINNEMTMITFGGSVLLEIDPRWDFEGFLRYQVPRSTGEVFAIQPNFNFDGSVGIIRKTEKKWGKGFLQWGVYWYGQWHDYGFTHYDRVLGYTIKGKQSLFFSNIDIRLVYSFD